MKHDTRLRCPFCKVRTWSNNYKQFMRDHDRADGRLCLKAAKHVAQKLQGVQS